MSGISKVNAPNGTIFDRLNDHGISWKDYYPDLPTCALFEPVFLNNPTKAVHMTSSSPTASWATCRRSASSILTPTSPRRTGTSRWGEGYAALFIDAVMRGPAWHKTALFWVYDEHGGWYDHVPPQPAVKPDNVAPVLAPGDVPGSYDHTGFRVPCCVVSAWSKKDYVSHHTCDHTSILKFVETKWNLPALTFRDANAHDMMDFFDLDREAAALRRAAGTEGAEESVPQGPDTLPPRSITTADQAQFHTTCTALPAGSLPPTQAKLAAVPSRAEALITAQHKPIQRRSGLRAR